MSESKDAPSRDSREAWEEAMAEFAAASPRLLPTIKDQLAAANANRLVVDDVYLQEVAAWGSTKEVVAGMRERVFAPIVLGGSAVAGTMDRPVA